MDASVWRDSPRVTAMLGRIKSLMDEPAPRRIPPDIWRNARSPIAIFLFWFGLAMSVALGGLIWVVVVADAPAVWVVVFAAECPVVCLMGLYSLMATRTVLRNGRLCRGKIVAVSPLPAHINGRTFFSVTLEFEGPGGQKLRGKDTADNWSSEYLLNARDTGEVVDVICAPNLLGKALLSMKIALGNRYD